MLHFGEVFHIRSIFPEQVRVEETSFALTPDNPQGEAVCSLFERYLCDRPPAFRDRIGFLKKGDFELDWSAAAGGVALASMFQAGAPASIGVLVSGADAAVDATMLEVFRDNVLSPLFGAEYDVVTEVRARPLLVQVVLSCDPEWIPAIQLLSASLASVYFRTVLQVSRESDRG